MLTTANAPKRYDFLDWLRVIAILVSLFFHTGMIFVGWGLAYRQHRDDRAPRKTSPHGVMMSLIR